MEKQKRWQLFLILAVIFLTVYNILPTVFFYSKPLDKSVDEKRATAISESIGQRVNSLESESLNWLKSYCKLLNVKPLSISFSEKEPEFIAINFKDEKDAEVLRNHITRAGALIPFVPAQLSLYNPSTAAPDKKVVVQRRIPLHFETKQLKEYFQFSKKYDDKGQPTDLYRALINDRALQLGVVLGGNSENAEMLQSAITPNAQNASDVLLSMSQSILSFAKGFGENNVLATRFFASFTQDELPNKQASVKQFIASLDELKDKLKIERIAIEQESAALKEQGGFLDGLKQQRLDILASQEKTLDTASAIVKRNAMAFGAGKTPLNFATFGSLLLETSKKMDPASKTQVISLNGRNPYIEQISIDWANEKITLKPYQEIIAFQETKNSFAKDKAEQLLFNTMAMAGSLSGEKILPIQDAFEVTLNEIPNSKSFLAMRLGQIAQKETLQLKELLKNTWNPKHRDLAKGSFPIWDYETYQSLSPEEKQLGLVIYAPATNGKMPAKGFRMSSIYIVAKGIDKILETLKEAPESAQAKEFMNDFNNLQRILQSNGFFGYRAASYAFSPEYASDFMFEQENYFQTVLKATREDFTVHGTKRYAILEFSDVEQRILTENKIDNQIHEGLLKWRDDYRAAQLDMKGVSHFDVPAPTQNAFLSNLKLSTVKYFRGDDRKVLHWGLDLSGGKTVQLELRDHNNRVVKDDMDIKQGINELYARVNKMGVSEVGIRQEGHTITLDFPGSQGLTAAELVKASSMYFHIVNEKFSTANANLKEAVNSFLQDVWNEAVITNRKSAEQINLIAWKHIHGDSFDPAVIQPRSESARLLYNQGLRIANPIDSNSNSTFNDTYSKVSLLRGDDFTDWHGQTHPLMFVFNNFALEGANLENVHASYDPSKGNYLSFGVQGSYTAKSGQKINPREDIFIWTSNFSKEKITGTPNAVFTQGRGWRMAVILNGSIISAPTLDSPLKDSAMITGSFTQREINQLEADLKAGSLTFTPHILSEKNVSPELGARERTLGILATLIALVLVIATMWGYYKFAGLIASIAVVFNLLIMWATLQNLNAAMTLAGIAGIILTVGMAVDANVLVFERIREEFAATGRIASAINAGYKKAFTAILDSNVTTVIAALVLLHSDSGPIKGFAVTLIIGIISSMFTALFMTRYFFAGWVQNPKNKTLSMAKLINATSFDFLKHTKATVIFSAIVILVGAFLLVNQRHTIFGMDFTGGYAITLELEPTKADNYREVVEKALVKQGAKPQDFQIRELNPSNNLRIFLSRSLEQKGRPFYGMPLETDPGLNYSYESNPKISWIVSALESSDLKIAKDSLVHLDKNWSDVSGQLSDTMRRNALIGLGIALVCILIYISFRFELAYALSATICMAHDVIFTIGALAILHALKVPVQIDMNTVAALLTIIGYSLNDTIIVFDRIREDMHGMRKSSLSTIINHALNVTLSRTTLTSGTTLLVLIPLIVLGGSTIFGFALVMAIGVIFGTLSSLFIAAPLMQYFHEKQRTKEQRLSLQ